jgi:hypothetical protein
LLNHLYEITCRADYLLLEITGGAKIRYNTYDLEEDFEFSIEALPLPLSLNLGNITDKGFNAAYQTIFKMSVLKPTDEALLC